MVRYAGGKSDWAGAVRPGVLTLAAVAVLALLSACGGGESPAPVESAPTGQIAEQSDAGPVLTDHSAWEDGESDAGDGPGAEGPGVEGPAGEVQSSEDAFAQDIALVAEAKGWTIEQAEKHYRASEIVVEIAREIRSARPGVFVGAVLPSEPDGAPVLYIKGPADELVRGIVAGAEIEIKIADNQPFSGDELDERKSAVTRALVDLGFEIIMAGYNIADEGRITAAVAREPGLPDDPEGILSMLPAPLRDGVELTVTDGGSNGYELPRSE